MKSMFNSFCMQTDDIEFNRAIKPLIIDRYDSFLQPYIDELKYAATDEAIIILLKDVFPEYYLRGNVQNAKHIIWDLYHINSSTVIRYQLSPIYAFVIFRIVELEVKLEKEMKSEGIFNLENLGVVANLLKE